MLPRLDPYITIALVVITCIAVAALSAGCSSHPDPGSPVYYRQGPEERPRSFTIKTTDALILARIKSRLRSDDLVDPEGVNIRVRHGVAILEGHGKDVYNRQMLVSLIRTVDGVVRVENRLDLN